MGISDQLKGPIFQEMMDLVKNQEGGLTGLLSKLKNSGLGEHVSSWIGTGENKSVEPGKLSSALGGNFIQSIAAKLGISHEEAESKVADAMPQMVDKLTPNGKIEEGENVLTKGWSAIKGLFD
jgi:uncharacterized protein YidB (DUF937 family)